MEEFSGLGLHLGNLARLSHAQTRFSAPPAPRPYPDTRLRSATLAASTPMLRARVADDGDADDARSESDSDDRQPGWLNDDALMLCW